MRMIYQGLALIAAAFVILMLDTPARAQHDGHREGHAKYHDWYQDWYRPHQPRVPCCSARNESDGEWTGDCAPVEAEVRPSDDPEMEGSLVWWARRHEDGKWVEIPKSRIVDYANPDPTGRDAHLCASNYGDRTVIHCFRPSTGVL